MKWWTSDTFCKCIVAFLPIIGGAAAVAFSEFGWNVPSVDLRQATADDWFSVTFHEISVYRTQNATKLYEVYLYIRWGAFALFCLSGFMISWLLARYICRQVKGMPCMNNDKSVSTITLLPLIIVCLVPFGLAMSLNRSGYASGYVERWLVFGFIVVIYLVYFDRVLRVKANPNA